MFATVIELLTDIVVIDIYEGYFRTQMIGRRLEPCGSVLSHVHTVLNTYDRTFFFISSSSLKLFTAKQPCIFSLCAVI